MATLLLLCSGAPRGNGVLLTQPRRCLRGVAQALADAGLHAEHLRALGLDAGAVATQTHASAEQLAELGRWSRW